jgi:hypothetical protein
LYAIIPHASVGEGGGRLLRLNADDAESRATNVLLMQSNARARAPRARVKLIFVVLPAESAWELPSPWRRPVVRKVAPPSAEQQKHSGCKTTCKQHRTPLPSQMPDMPSHCDER